MTEQQKAQSKVEEHVNAAVDHVGEAADAAVSLGRQDASLWVGVSRSAIEAAAQTVSSTSEMVSTLAKSMGELSTRLDDSAKKA